jgi:hypothetical protein
MSPFFTRASASFRGTSSTVSAEHSFIVMAKKSVRMQAMFCIRIFINRSFISLSHFLLIINGAAPPRGTYAPEA